MYDCAYVIQCFITDNLIDITGSHVPSFYFIFAVINDANYQMTVYDNVVYMYIFDFANTIATNVETIITMYVEYGHNVIVNNHTVYIGVVGINIAKVAINVDNRTTFM